MHRPPTSRPRRTPWKLRHLRVLRFFFVFPFMGLLEGKDVKTGFRWRERERERVRKSTWCSVWSIELLCFRSQETESGFMLPMVVGGATDAKRGRAICTRPCALNPKSDTESLFLELQNPTKNLKFEPESNNAGARKRCTGLVESVSARMPISGRNPKPKPLSGLARRVAKKNRHDAKY